MVQQNHIFEGSTVLILSQYSLWYCPILLASEDNNTTISTSTPCIWVEQRGQVGIGVAQPASWQVVDPLLVQLVLLQFQLLSLTAQSLCPTQCHVKTPIPVPLFQLNLPKMQSSLPTNFGLFSNPFRFSWKESRTLPPSPLKWFSDMCNSEPIIPNTRFFSLPFCYPPLVQYVGPASALGGSDNDAECGE